MICLVSLCWSLRMSNFSKSVIYDAPVWWSYGYWYYEFGIFSITVLILQVLTDLDNSISYSGLLALDWNYPWRTRHGFHVHWTMGRLWSSEDNPVFQLSIIFNNGELTLHCWKITESLHNERVTGLGFIC